MWGMGLKLASLCLLAVLAATGAARGAEPIHAFVSILPQTYFVHKVGGDRVRAEVMVLPGASPATYEPKPAQMVALTRAQVYFAIGVPFERVWLPRIAAGNPRLIIVPTQDGIQRLSMAAHDHAETGPSTAAALDPHVWLAPLNAKIMARNILGALIDLSPADRPLFEANYAAFAEEIDALDADLRRIFADRQGTRFMVFHPSWGYFAHAYGLTQIPIEVEGKEPKPAELGRLIAAARAQGIRVIFVQPQFSTRAAQTIAQAIGGQVVFADPLSPDWEQNLRRQAEAFRQASR